MKLLLSIFIICFCVGCVEVKDGVPYNQVVQKDTLTDIKSNKLKLIKEKPVGESIDEMREIFHLEFQYGDRTNIGTGFFVKKDGKKYIVTAGHNVGRSDNIRVFRNNGPIKVVVKKYKVDYKVDIAVIEVETDEPCFELHKPIDMKSIPVFGNLYKETSYKPMSIEMYGYPGSWGFRKVIGKIYQVMKYNNHMILVSTGKCESGMSGGPWLSDCKVIAIHTKKLSITIDNKVTKGSGATPVNAIYKMIDALQEK